MKVSASVSQSYIVGCSRRLELPLSNVGIIIGDVVPAILFWHTIYTLASEPLSRLSAGLAERLVLPLVGVGVVTFESFLFGQPLFWPSGQLLPWLSGQLPPVPFSLQRPRLPPAACLPSISSSSSTSPALVPSS